MNPKAVKQLPFLFCWVYEMFTILDATDLLSHHPDESRAPSDHERCQGSQAHSFGHHHAPAAADFLEPTHGSFVIQWPKDLDDLDAPLIHVTPLVMSKWP